MQEGELEQEEISSSGSAIMTSKVDKHLLKEKDMIRFRKSDNDEWKRGFLIKRV